MNKSSTNNRNHKLALLVALLVGAAVFFAAETKAASAVAFDSATGTYGYSYGQRSLRDAQTDAVRRCQRSGGTSCRVIVSCAGAGYGMIYLRRLPGQRIQAIGASCGAATVDDAQRVASNNCNRVGRGQCSGRHGSWYDNVGVRPTVSATYPNLASRGEPIRWDTSLVNTRKFNRAQYPGETFTLFCPSRGYISQAYGSGVYHISSSVCTAAVHRGVITTNGGTVRIRIVSGPAVFEGSLRNGVRTFRSQPPDPRWRIGFVFI